MLPIPDRSSLEKEEGGNRWRLDLIPEKWSTYNVIFKKAVCPNGSRSGEQIVLDNHPGFIGIGHMVTLMGHYYPFICGNIPLFS
jgi:hypothetical protein